MPGQGVSAMIIQQGRNEMHLDIGPVVFGMPADNKSTSFCNVRTAGPLAPKQVTQTYRDVTQLIIGSAMVGGYQGANIEMILQVFSHAGEIVARLKVHLAKMFRRADP